MKVDKAKKALRDTVSRSVNQIISYKYGFKYRWSNSVSSGNIIVIPADKHEFFQVYFVHWDLPFGEDTSYGTLYVSKHILKYLLINYFKRTTYYSNYMYLLEHGDSKSRKEVNSINSAQAIVPQITGRFVQRNKPELDSNLQDMLKIKATIEDFEKLLNQMS